MKLRVVLPLLACVALAACGGTPATTGNTMSNDLLDPAKEMARRWASLFTDGATIALAAKDMGYAAPEVTKPDGTGGFHWTSPDQVVDIVGSPVKTRTNLVATGAAAKTVDSYRFTFDASGDDGKDTKAASNADKIPLRVLNGFLGRFGVAPDDEIKVAIKTVTPITKALPGATIAYDPGKLDDPKLPRNRHSVLTITRPGAKAPTVPQNQAARK